MQTTGTYRRIITYIRDTNTAVNQNPAVLSTDNVAEEFHTRNETGLTYRPITPVISRGPPFPPNYFGLKLLDQVIKVLERVAENFLQQQVHIDDIQLGFMPGQMPYLLYASYKKNSMPSTRHCTWSFLMWKRHSIVCPDVSPCELFASLALRSGWFGSHRACMKINARSSP